MEPGGKIDRRARSTAVEFPIWPPCAPIHPDTFAGIPLPVAMKQEEPIDVLGAKPLVETCDARARRLEQRHIVRHVPRRRVREVAEEGEVDARIHVAQRHHLEVLEERLHPGDARQQRRTIPSFASSRGRGSDRSRRDSRCGRIMRAIKRWINAIATSLAGINNSRSAATWTIAEPC